MSLQDFLDLENEALDNLYDKIATEIKSEEFIATKLMAPGIRHLSESMTVYEKHLLLWDILINSTPNYRKAVSSRLRRMVAESSKSPSPNPLHVAPIPSRRKSPGLPFYDKTTSETAGDVEMFIRILRDANPWWYVLNVDHDPFELSKVCYGTFKEFLNPMIKWDDVWLEILPVIGTVNLDGKVRLKLI